MSSNKSFSTETSERYSRALYEVAKESNELEKVERDINIFQDILLKSFELRNFIHNPTQSIENQKKAADILTEKLSFSKNLQNFLLLLIQKRRIFYVTKIISFF